MSTPSAKGLFHKAIVQSGAASAYEKMSAHTKISDVVNNGRQIFYRIYPENDSRAKDTGLSKITGHESTAYA